MLARRLSTGSDSASDTTLARSEFGRTADSFDREWLVTNGLGGFASGTVAQANTRRYHGLLVAALRPPVDRVVMVSKLDVTARYRGETYELACNEYADGTIEPNGFKLLSAFGLENGIPMWTYSLADALLEQRVWMASERNTTYVRFNLREATGPVDLKLLPLCTYRDYHAHGQGGWSLHVDPEDHGCRITAFDGARSYCLLLERGEFTEQKDWYWQFRHRRESERGLDAIEDLFRPGIFHARLQAGETITFIATAESTLPENASVAFERECQRRQSLLQISAADTPEWIRRLTLAADQFIVKRCGGEGSPDGATVIAGYPWFGDWGRDTMIALPGLTLATGRETDAAAILRTFARHLSQGMLPNRFPDRGEMAEYNTVDATLWYFHAIAAYLQKTADQTLLRELYPVLKEIVDWHRRGTRYSIHVDPSDGLLYAGESGAQLTWMDAKLGDWVVTPRIGKPVEINALWHYALIHMAAWARTLKDTRAAADYEASARRVAVAFGPSFWCKAGGYLYDVIDGPEGELDSSGRRVDSSLRPNQIFAVALGTELLEAEQAKAVVDACARELLTPVGLRSLSLRDARYVGTYFGGPEERDAAYHQGTVWSWLLGPFVLAHYRVYRNAEHGRRLLSGLASHLNEACLGTISEVFDGNPPFIARGCFAQAWSVSETLRAWRSLSRVTGTAHAELAQSAEAM
jgi:predicted glycogen debranching enzyme